MSRRNKTRIEKWFSFSRHKRRLGAKNLSNLINTDFSQQKKILLSAGDIAYTHGSSKNLEEHFINLKKEFSGLTELHYTHAKIIVLIRRDYKAQEHFRIFENIWLQEKKYLLKNLNTRWLISATDTFADYSDDATTRALSLACACLFNTIKIQETERFFQHAEKFSDDAILIEQIQSERHALFDGTSAFTIGTDDTLRNMRWRIDKMATVNIAGEILQEIFLRLQENETVYRRFRNRHARNKTGWW